MFALNVIVLSPIGSNACASVGIGMGVDKNLLATVGAGLAQAQNIKFLGGIHGKVY